MIAVWALSFAISRYVVDWYSMLRYESDMASQTANLGLAIAHVIRASSVGPKRKLLCFPAYNYSRCEVIFCGRESRDDLYNLIDSKGYISYARKNFTRCVRAQLKIDGLIM